MSLRRRSPAVEVLQEALTDVQTHNAQLQHRVAELEQQLHEAENERDDAKARVERVAAALAEVEQRVAQAEGRQSEERSRAQAELARVRAQLRSELIEARAALAHTQERLAAESAAAEQARSDHHDLIRRAERAEAELVGMYAEVDVARAGRGSLRERVAGLESELGVLTDLLAGAREALEAQTERARLAEQRAAAAIAAAGEQVNAEPAGAEEPSSSG